MDRGPESHKIIDRLIELTKEYGDQVTCIMGNHEWLFLASIGAIPSPPVKPGLPTPLEVWLQHGGIQTIKGYCDSVGIDGWQTFPIHRMINIVPKEHVDFLMNETYKAYELGDYIFTHAGCEPDNPLDDQDEDIFLWDRSLYKTALRCIHHEYDMPWSKTVVCGHNYDGPIISEKYMMLDCSGKKALLVAELNSMEGFYAYPGRTRMLRANLEETTKIPKSMMKHM